MEGLSNIRVIWFLLIFAAVILDRLLGDPGWLPHPIVFIGRYIGFLRDRLNRGAHRKLKGFLLLFIVVSTIGIGVLALQPLFSGIHVLLAVLFNLYLLFSALSAKTLRVEVEKVEACLDKGDLNASEFRSGTGGSGHGRAHEKKSSKQLWKPRGKHYRRCACASFLYVSGIASACSWLIPHFFHGV